MSLGTGGGGGGASSGDVRAGGAFVEISANDSKLQSALNAAKAKVQAFGATVVKVGATAAGAGASLLGPIAKSAKEAIDHIGDVGSLQKKFGGSVEDMSKLAYAFKTTGVDAEELEGLLKKLAKATSMEADNPKGGILERIGIDARKFIGMSPEEKISKIQQQLAKIPNEDDKIRVAMELMGKSGDRALKLLGLSTEEYRERLAQAAEDGYVYNAEQVKEAKSISRGWKEVKTVATSAALSIGEAVLPLAGYVALYARAIRLAYIQGREWVESHKALFQIIAAAGVGLIATGTAFIFIGKAISLVGAGIGGLLIPFKMLIALGSLLIGAVLSPIGLIVAAVAGLTAVWITQTESGQKFATGLKAGFIEAADTAKEAWGGIVAAIQKGDLELAVKIAVKGIQVLWLQFAAFLTKVWVDFKDTFVDIWHQIQNTISEGLIDSGIGARFFQELAAFKELYGLGDDEEIRRDRAAAEELRRDADSVKRHLKQTNDEEARQRKAFRDAQIKAALEDWENAKKDLGALVQKAKEPKAGALPPNVQDELDKHKKMMQVDFPAAVKGVFSSPNYRAALGIGESNIQKRQLLVQQDMNENIKAVIDAVKNIAPVKFK